MQGFMKRCCWAMLLALLAKPAIAASCLKYDGQGDFLGWADYPHCLVDQHTQSTVRWLDDWFSQPPKDAATELTPEVALAQARVRLINEWVVDSHGNFTPALRLRASVALPQLARRLSLVFEDESGQARRIDGVPAINEAALALRWAVLNLKRLHVDTDVGLHSATDLFVRARLRQSLPLSERDEFKAFHSLRYGLQDGWRAIESLELTHAFDERRVGVLYHQFDYQQDQSADGVHWSRGALIAEEVSATQTMSYGVGQEGVTRPSWRPRTDSLWWRWRQRVARDWFFIEVEPRLTRSHLDGEDARPSLAVRFEVLWGGEAVSPVLQRTAVFRSTAFIKPDTGMSLTP